MMGRACSSLELSDIYNSCESYCYVLFITLFILGYISEDSFAHHSHVLLCARTLLHIYMALKKIF